ncbi:ribonuclease III, partial [Patescibacteria group bacterium]|nr:ribonuclease III [Patescibacteria group bacterium]
MESLIGAIYLDQGYDAAKKFISKFILKELPGIIENQSYR